jgi:hypothetical protein
MCGTNEVDRESGRCIIVGTQNPHTPTDITERPSCLIADLSLVSKADGHANAELSQPIQLREQLPNTSEREENMKASPDKAIVRAGISPNAFVAISSSLVQSGHRSPNRGGRASR